MTFFKDAIGDIVIATILVVTWIVGFFLVSPKIAKGKNQKLF
jgi:hypothetical protein